MIRKCKLCQENFTGRSDKIFCKIKCKSEYYIRLNEVTINVSKRIDRILHRNRSILLEILGKNKKQIKVTRLLLDKKRFNWHYITHYHINSRQKMVHYLYDLSWVMFSDQEVLIARV